ncbi:MAG: hypothetical protein IT580_06910 [Verrucomicrobiales bacterium]|nr:hypothetical protein [Verrucomicrobiales bacterium]
MAKARRPQHLYGTRILRDAAGTSRVWTFTGHEMKPAGVVDAPVDRALPAKLVGKGWGQLIRPRANVLWLSGRPVFVQLVLLPTDDAAEVAGMVELQLERLSPLPVGQVVWGHEILKSAPTKAGLPVLVMIAARSEVEGCLGALEKRGFCADRVETPLLSFVSGVQFDTDGAYILVHQAGEQRVCLVGWVADGALRALNVVNLAADERWPRQLRDELGRLAWAGEIEGWTADLSRTFLVAEHAVADAWRATLERELSTQVVVREAASDESLAASTAARAAAGEAGSNLLPPELAARYRQEFTDRLWMGGLGALLGAYLIGVLIYLGAVEVQRYRHEQLADQVAQTNIGYTNTLRLKAQTQVLQEMVNLRYAALDSWLATVEVMPEELSLESLTFSGGQTLVITGYAPQGQESKITEYWQNLRKKIVGNTNLFSEVQLRPTTARTVQGTPQTQWSFTCKILRQEI